MGFRATFMVEHAYYGALPTWFVEKWAHAVWFKPHSDGSGLPAYAKHERKDWDGEFLDDLVKVYPETGLNKDMTMLMLWECGGITKVRISKYGVSMMTPDGWRPSDGPGHYYCYGCSSPGQQFCTHNWSEWTKPEQAGNEVHVDRDYEEDIETVIEVSQTYHQSRQCSICGKKEQHDFRQRVHNVLSQNSIYYD